MSKAIATYVAILLLAHCSDLCIAWKSSTFWQVHPYAVAFSGEDKIYTVSHREDFYKIHEYVKSKGEQKLVCELKVDPSTEVINYQYTLKAAAFYRRIVVWGKRTQETIVNSNVKRLNYTVLLIDPFRCTYHAFPGIDEEGSNAGFVYPEVLVHRDSFDVFFATGKKCSPCSFDINGDEIIPTNKLKYNGSQTEQFILRRIGFTDRYVYLYTDDDKTSALTLLDRYFSDLPKNRIFAGEVHKLETSASQMGSGKAFVGVIYAAPKFPRRKILEVFDEDLYVVYSTTLPLLEDHDFIDASLLIDAHGKSYVTLIQRFNTTDRITHVKFDEKGQNLGDEEIHQLQTPDWLWDYQMASFLDEDDYCFVINELPDRTNITCSSGLSNLLSSVNFYLLQIPVVLLLSRNWIIG